MTIINLIGHFLKENGFEQTFQKFEEEYGQPICTETHELPNKETLNEIINDRFNFKSIQQEISKIDTPLDNKDFKPWKTPYPKNLYLDTDIDQVIVSVDIVLHKNWVLLSTAKQKLIIVDFNGKIVNIFDQIIGRLVIKKIVSDSYDNVYLAGMSGVIYHFKIEGEELTKVNELQVHRRLIVDMKIVEIDSEPYLVSLGFDKLIKLISLRQWDVSASFEISNIPSCFDVINYQNQVVALVGYNENTLLDLVHAKSSKELERLYRISINDAEFTTSNFSPRIIKFNCFDKQLLVAVGTSHEPYMRVMVLPITDFTATNDIRRNQISKNILTMSPQDKFSIPVISWRKDGTGIWVLGDDGILRGINLANDKIIEIPCHNGRVKFVETYDLGGETVVTIGDDRHIKVWK
ncbi:hypothetical protein CANTEDRAFT_113888 [Yamadazyma tenuis ATCC 10573]|uniref:WD40 repeat-like protein n=1 Tax=Candida tenuis (strain ATCC 10573 / BCRC 21748 / CBS 615 / JCM 9827 / NBRC 10315 / NRRL Y-1498 / VKM Y-70) TaxID=590646 RepID=G3B4T4_CANTC|nr:WD40 repeat-like protein [Yamadazyma tenuis ATCC 10573]XP_006686582.1 uncharacterized protein CANTEDRAFT_113888 [Yamadazyma tenuis ATCC 10573]EGV64267.1 WD40 repeat-like protein [Yamadazyma tenuis ATCC 10573]EGV64268.1 hypothetical protein CANTEDRAFT_113888 [Yamadazyma tenuis ATCC 10573]